MHLSNDTLIDTIRLADCEFYILQNKTSNLENSGLIGTISNEVPKINN